MRQNRSHTVSFKISDSLYHRLALRATGFDTPSGVIERLLNERESFDTNLLEAKPRSVSTPVEPNSPSDQFKKLHKIKEWGENKDLVVSQVIQQYFDMVGDNKNGTDRNQFISILTSFGICKGNKKNIIRNIDKMKRDFGKENPYGKIFYLLQNNIYMYDVVYKEALKYFKPLKKQS